MGMNVEVGGPLFWNFRMGCSCGMAWHILISLHFIALHFLNRVI